MMKAKNLVQKEREIDLLLDNAFLLESTDIAASYQIAYDALEESKNINYRFGEAKSHLLIGMYNSFYSQYKEAISHLHKALDILVKLPANKYLAQSYLAIGIIHKNCSEYAEAKKYYDKGLLIAKEVEDIKVYTATLTSIGNLYKHLGAYEQALQCFHECLEYKAISEETILQSAIYNNIGNLYDRLGNYADAFEYFDRSLRLKKESAEHRGIANVLNNIAIVYGKQKNFTKALEYYSEALKIYKELGFKEGIVAGNSNIADAYIQSKKFVKAIPHLLKAITLCREISNPTHLAIALSNLSSTYSKVNEILKAEELLPEIETLIQTIEAKAVRLEIHRDMSYVYEALGNVMQSLVHHREFHRLDKEIFNEESDRRLQNLHIIHQVEQMKKDKEIAEQKAVYLQKIDEAKTNQLTSLALHLVQRNNLIENISHEVQKTLVTLDDAKRKLLKNVLHKIREANLQEFDWEQFEEQFLKVHSEYMHRLTKQHPQLSQAELKVCTLLKLHLTSKQIASLLNIALRTVEYHRLNTRKKLNLPKKTNLVAYLQNL